MDSTRMRLMAEELAILEEEKKKNPDLFPETTWVDDPTLLERLGIHIPGKDLLPSAYLKLLPSDFIVEEIREDGTQSSVSHSFQETTDVPGETVYATLVKCGLSTIEAVEELATILGTTKDKVQYAGIKDKDAITSQFISIRGIPKEKVCSIRSPHFFLKDIYTGKGVVEKGRLKGNRFTILLRMGKDIENKEKINSALRALEKVHHNGFYNFFYLQRFGTPRLNNYKWGISILKGDYEKAIKGLIADKGIREIPFFLNMRDEIIALYPNWDAMLEKLNKFPLVFPSEIKVATHLRENPTDFKGALKKIEEQVSLWVTAVASLLFNRKISSYLLADMQPPKTLPLFLSPDKNAWLPYSEDLEEKGVFPPPLHNLKPFPKLSVAHREISTRDHAEIIATEVIPEGIVIQFTLGKGEYATTFLSHFVNLMGGKVPEDISTEIIDTKNLLKEENSATLKFFESLNIRKR